MDGWMRGMRGGGHSLVGLGFGFGFGFGFRLLGLGCWVGDGGAGGVLGECWMHAEGMNGGSE